MKRKRFGFTLIEVSIFLAVTGALFVAITVGVQNSIYQQRYNDTVQSFADFLGNLYSEVANVQSDSNGRHDEAIYGKMVTFGEEQGNEAENKQVMHVYTVIAKAVNSWDVVDSNTLGLLKTLQANVVRKNSDGKYEAVGIIEDYTPKWSARVQKTDSFEDYTGTILIIRNAKSGTIQTFALNNVIDVKDRIVGDLSGDPKIFEYGEDKNYLDDFRPMSVDFCINPNGSEESNNRADVRLVKGAHDASGVEIIPFDSDNNKCRR